MNNLNDDSVVRLRNSLLGILEIKGYRYYNPQTDEKRIGLNTNEIEQFYPELIDENDEIDYKGFIPILLEAINELHHRICALEKDKLKKKYQSNRNH